MVIKMDDKTDFKKLKEAELRVKRVTKAVIELFFEEGKGSARERTLFYIKRVNMAIFLRETDSKLQKTGVSEIVDQILEKIHSLKDDEYTRHDYGWGGPILDLVHLVTELAEPKHDYELATMLQRPLTISRADSTIRAFILSTLETIGTSRVVPILKEYDNKIDKIEYIWYEKVTSGLEKYRVSQEADIRKRDRERVRKAITACEKRKEISQIKT